MWSSFDEIGKCYVQISITPYPDSFEGGFCGNASHVFFYYCKAVDL